MATGTSVQGLKERKWYWYLQKGQEGGPQETTVLLHDLPHYYREIEGTEILSRTFECNEVQTPLQIPSCPTTSQDNYRYKVFRECFYCCKLPWRSEMEHGRIALPVLPEDHRAKNKSLRTFVKRHQHYGSGVDPCPSWVVLFNYLIHPQENSINCSGMMLGSNLMYCGLLVRYMSNECNEESNNSDCNTILPEFADEKGQIYHPKPPKPVAPNSTVKKQEHTFSPRTTNTLQNSERALRITAYSQDCTGRGPINPLMLDNYYMKAVGRLTELGEDMEQKETFPPSVSQVRPLEGCTAGLLKGSLPHESILEEEDSSSVQMPSPLRRVLAAVASCSDTMLSKIKTVASTGQQHEVTESTDQNWDKITDTLQMEPRHRVQLSGRPEPESLPKSTCSLSYRDFKPRYLDQHTVWESSVSLSKPGLPLDVKSEESIILLHKLYYQEACQPARLEDRPRETALMDPEWIPSREVPQHQHY
ncbi:LOW QUALITY PROTEIN: sperm-associated microtubule inner protein 4 [Porphyrio hochstetteri]